VNTRTAERTFALKTSFLQLIKVKQTVHCHEPSLPLRGYPFRRPCIAALSLTLIALASKP
jgi:hypothetical protein